MDPMAFMHLSSVLDPNMNGGIDFGAYMPSYEQQNSLDTLLGNYPTQQDPGFLKKLLAGFAGAGVAATGGAGKGIEATMGLLNSPFEQQVADWQNQAKVQQQLASDENASNTQKRLLLGQQLTNAQKENALQETIRNNEVKNNIAQQNADTNAARMRVMQETAKGGTLEFDTAGAPIMVYKDGTAKPLTNADGTPFNAALFTPQMKQQMIDDAAMARTNATQAGALQRERETQAGENSRAASAVSRGPHVSAEFQGADGKTYALMSDRTVVPLEELTGATRMPSAPVAPTTTVTDTKTVTPPSHVGEIISNIPGLSFFGQPTTSKDTTTTRTTQRGNAPAGSQQQAISNTIQDPAIRQKAADALRSHNLPTDPASIDKFLANPNNRAWLGIK